MSIETTDLGSSDAHGMAEGLASSPHMTPIGNRRGPQSRVAETGRGSGAGRWGCLLQQTGLSRSIGRRVRAVSGRFRSLAAASPSLLRMDPRLHKRRSRSPLRAASAESQPSRAVHVPLNCAQRVVVALATMGALGFPSIASAGECPNEQLRAVSNSSGLPACRAYELVSPANAPVEPVSLAAKLTSTDNGGVANGALGPALLAGGNLAAQLAGPLDVQAGGSTVFWESKATPEGAGAIENGGSREPFRSVRTSSGWSSESVFPRPSLNSENVSAALLGASTDASSTLIATNTLLPADSSAFENPRQGESGEWPGVFVYRVSTDGAPPQLITQGKSLLPETAKLFVDDKVPFAALSASPDLSEVAFKSLVALEPGDTCIPPVGELNGTYAIETFGTVYLWNTNSLDGFARQLVSEQTCAPGSPNIASVPTILPERGSVVVPGPGLRGMGPELPQVQRLTTNSLPGAFVRIAADAGGTFLGEADAGATAYVLSEGNLYAVSTKTGWEGPTNPCISCSTDQTEVHYLTSSLDGAHVLFTTDQGLWEWDASSGAQLLGAVSGVERSDILVSENGRYVVVRTAASLSGTDTNGAPDLYELSPGTQPLLLTAGISADRYVLRQHDALESEATPTVEEPPSGGVSNNGAQVVYGREPVGGTPAVIDQWANGQTTQISPLASTHAYEVDAIAGGELEDVFFLAEDAIVPWDDNAGTPNVYDARIDGGFPSCTLGDPLPHAGASSCAPSSQTANPSAPPPTPYSTNLTPPSSQVAALSPDTSHTNAPVQRRLTTAQKLSAALKTCRKDKRRSRRRSCEKAAHKKYPTKTKAKTKAVTKGAHR